MFESSTVQERAVSSVTTSWSYFCPTLGVLLVVFRVVFIVFLSVEFVMFLRLSLVCCFRIWELYKHGRRYGFYATGETPNFFVLIGDLVFFHHLFKSFASFP